MGIAEREERILRKYNDLKERRIQLETKRNMILEEIKEKYGVDGVEALKAKVASNNKEIERLEGKLLPLLDRLEEGLGL